MHDDAIIYYVLIKICIKNIIILWRKSNKSHLKRKEFNVIVVI